MSDAGRVLISADDFGLTAGVNRAIVEALEGGYITSTSIITGHPGTSEALAYAADRHDLDVGIHFNLTDGRCVSGHPGLATIVDPSGIFRGRKHLTSAVASGAVDFRAVRVEIDAQIDLCRKLGLKLSHCNSHHYVHVLHDIDAVIRGCAADAGVPMIRAAGYRPLLSPIVTVATRGRRRLGPTLATSRSNAKRPRDARVASDYVVPLGLPIVGPVPVRMLAAVLKSVSGAVVEIVTHPGYETTELAEHSNYVGERQKELAALKSGVVRELIETAGLRPTTFCELAAANCEIPTANGKLAAAR